MNSWSQTNSQNTNFNPYMSWQPSRLPVYNAAPIHGENAAWQFPMGANSEIYLPDADNDIIWWIRTDNVGSRTVTPFDVTLHKNPAPVDLDNLVERINQLEERINAKSNKPNAKRPTTNDPAASIE